MDLILQYIISTNLTYSGNSIPAEEFSSHLIDDFDINFHETICSQEMTYLPFVVFCIVIHLLHISQFDLTTWQWWANISLIQKTIVIHKNQTKLYYTLNQLLFTITLFHDLAEINWFATTIFHDHA